MTSRLEPIAHGSRRSSTRSRRAGRCRRRGTPTPASRRSSGSASSPAPGSTAARRSRSPTPGSFMATQAGPHPDRRHARSRGHPARLRQRLPPPRVRRSRAAAAAARRCSARTTRGRTGSTARCARHRARSARRASTAADFSLLPVSVDTWGPFLFVNPDPAAAPLAETLGELPAIVARSGLDLSTLASTPITSGRSTPTGRSRSRTTSSATTARPPIPASAR